MEKRFPLNHPIHPMCAGGTGRHPSIHPPGSNGHQAHPRDFKTSFQSAEDLCTSHLICCSGHAWRWCRTSWGRSASARSGRSCPCRVSPNCWVPTRDANQTLGFGILMFKIKHQLPIKHQPWGVLWGGVWPGKWQLLTSSVSDVPRQHRDAETGQSPTSSAPQALLVFGQKRSKASTAPMHFFSR